MASQSHNSQLASLSVCLSVCLHSDTFVIQWQEQELILTVQFMQMAWCNEQVEMTTAALMSIIIKMHRLGRRKEEKESESAEEATGKGGEEGEKVVE